MKTTRLFTAMALVILTSTCNSVKQKEENTSAPKKITQGEVEQVMDNWLKLWATYELSMLDQIFYESEDLTYFSSEKEGLMIGFEELIPHHVSFGFLEGGKKPEKSLWLEDIDIRLYGESAVAGGVWYFGDKEVAKDSVSKGPVTFVFLRNDEGEVRIIHTHFANY